MYNQKGYVGAIIATGVVLFILITGASFYLGRTSVKPKATPSPLVLTSQNLPSPSPSINLTSDHSQQHYCNNKVGFCVNLPVNCQESEIKLGQAEDIPAVEFNCPTVEPAGNDIFHISSSSWKNNFDLNSPQYCSADVCDSSDGGFFKSSRKVEIINGVSFYYHMTPIPPNFSYIYFVQKGKLFDLRYGYQDDLDNPGLFKDFLTNFSAL